MDDGGGRRVVDTMEGQDTHTGKHSVIASWVRHNFLWAYEGQLTMVGLSGGQDWLGGKRRRRSGASVFLLGFSDRASGGE